MINLTSVINNGIKTEYGDPDELLERVSRGDSAAFEVLYKSMKGAVYGYALSILKNTHDAEDVLHDCFVNIYKAAPAYQRRGKARSWIMSITHNLCVQRIRERSKTSDLPQEDWEPYIEGAQQLSSEDRLTLEQCMKLLSDEERQIVTLHAVAGFKHREIAEMLNMPLSTVLSKYNRSLKKLREAV